MRKSRTAVQMSNWHRRNPRARRALTSYTGDVNNGAPLMVEILLLGTWVDVAALGYVLYDNKVNVTRGQASEGSQVSPGRCSFTMQNFEEQGYPWSSENPVSPYYQVFGHGTRVRVSVPSGFDKSYRFQGEITNLEEGSDETGRFATVYVEAAGILDRLGRGDEPLRSAFYRETTRPDTNGVSPRQRLPIAYWPMEDGPDSQFLAGVFTTEQMNFTAAHPGLATFTEFGCSDAIPNMSNSKWAAYVPPHTVDLTQHNAQTVWFLMSAATDFAIGTGIIRVVTKTHRWELVYVSAGNLRLRGLDYDNVVIFDSTVPVTVIDTERWYGLHWRDDTSTTTVALYSQAVGENAFTAHIEAVTTIDNSPILNVQLNWAITATDFYIGHVAVFQHKTGDSIDCGSIYNPSADALNAFAGERADTRFDRLCREEQITHETLNPVTASWLGAVQGVGQKMGIQRPTTLLTLLQECEATDGGTLYEMTSDFGLGYRTLESITNQAATVSLSHGNSELSEQPVPKRDTNHVVNDATVQRDGGAEFQTVDETSRMSIHDYPAGIGRFNNQKTLSLYKDAQCADQAGWMKHLGTVSEPRYERIAINFARDVFVVNPTLRRTCLSVRPGDRVDITDTPARLSYDDITQLAVGYSEEIDQFQHKIAWNSIPEKPYRVAVVGTAGYDRIDAAASHLMEDVSTTATTLLVDSLDGTRWIDLQNYASKFPFDIKVGGERMTVTGITGITQDQFTRSETDSWGNADVGGAWNEQGGTAADFDVNGTKGTLTLPTVNVSRRALLQTASPDIDQYIDISTDQLSTGERQGAMLIARSFDANNMYMARLAFETTAAITLSLRKRVGGVESELTSVTTELTHVANTVYRLRFRLEGSLLRAKAWLASAAIEPDTWQVRAVDTDLDNSRDVGVRSILFTGNTNVNPVHSFDNYMGVSGQYFTVTRSVNGVVKAHTAGTEVHINDVVYLAL